MENDLPWAARVRQVYERASFYCEYCRTNQAVIGQSMHVDHIDPAGGDDLANLCLACPTCNLSKGAATSSADPETGESVSLFNPREQVWPEHFEWVDGGQRIRGLTPTGRATVERLAMNLDRVVVARSLWIRAGLHPPLD
jgi:hypothetical protein